MHTMRLVEVGVLPLAVGGIGLRLAHHMLSRAEPLPAEVTLTPTPDAVLFRPAAVDHVGLPFPTVRTGHFGSKAVTH